MAYFAELCNVGEAPLVRVAVYHLVEGCWSR